MARSESPCRDEVAWPRFWKVHWKIFHTLLKFKLAIDSNSSLSLFHSVCFQLGISWRINLHETFSCFFLLPIAVIAFFSRHSCGLWENVSASLDLEGRHNNRFSLRVSVIGYGYTRNHWQCKSIRDIDGWVVFLADLII